MAKSQIKSWIYAKGNKYLSVKWVGESCFVQETDNIDEAALSPILFLGTIDKIEAEGWKITPITISTVRTADV